MDVETSLEMIPTAALSDAQTGLTTMAPGIPSRVPGAKPGGPAFTVLCLAGSIPTVHHALLAARPGDMLVVDGQGDPSSALFGELVARDAGAAGPAGVVVDGAVRDVRGLRDLGFPTFARSVTPRVGTNRRPGKIGLQMVCAGGVVKPGDWIVGDDDGVGVVPKRQLPHLVETGLEIEE